MQSTALLLVVLSCAEPDPAPANFSASYQLDARSGGQAYSAQLVIVAEPPERLRLELIHMAQTNAVAVFSGGRIRVANFERREWIDAPANDASARALLGIAAGVPELLFALSGAPGFLPIRCRPDTGGCLCDDGGSERVYRFGRSAEGGWAEWHPAAGATQAGAASAAAENGLETMPALATQALLSAHYQRLRARGGSEWPERIAIEIRDPEVSLRLELLDLRLDRSDIDPSIFALEARPSLSPVPWDKVLDQAPYLWR
ncbi:MAG TPA: hypothetical protein VGB99_08165 [Acidobacteriota bacterium]